jgi:hypothetical protein
LKPAVHRLEGGANVVQLPTQSVDIPIARRLRGASRAGGLGRVGALGHVDGRAFGLASDDRFASDPIGGAGGLFDLAFGRGGGALGDDAAIGLVGGRLTERLQFDF